MNRQFIPIIQNEDVKRFAELSIKYDKSQAIKRIIELEKQIARNIDLKEALERAQEVGFKVKEEIDFKKRYTDL